ncbi:MAG: MarR family transcriptional regulator [Dehalococcoidia bacterium]|nr:MarR family transcriptional regulator [Dehalococcoidia bacterium]
MTNPTNERALRAYVRAMTVADPIRLRFWDRRGLTMPQLRVIYLIRESGDPSVGDLATEMHIRAATLTGIAERLVKQRLVRRFHDSKDRRIVRLRLTNEGQRILDEITIAGTAYIEAVFAALGLERVDALTNCLEEFANAAERITETGEDSV